MSSIGVQLEHTFGEGPNHGEGYNYTIASQTVNEYLNRSAVDNKILEAIDAIDPDDGSIKAMEILGWALHMAQDRGSHEEGTKGLGHDRKEDKLGTYDTDSKADNPQGYKNSEQYSMEAISDFFDMVNNYNLDLGTQNSKIEETIESDNQSFVTLETLLKNNNLNQLREIEIADYIEALIQGVCTDEEENLINQVLAASTLDRMYNTIYYLGQGSIEKGIDRLDSGIDGEEWDQCLGIMARDPELRDILASL